jgi:Putative zinc-finger
VEHQEAIDIHAAEGYLLGNLPAAQHDAFEEHFADCEPCFADVRDGATMITALRGGKKKPVPSGHHRFIPTLAAAASIAVAISAVGYQQAQIARLRKPSFAPVAILDERRGPESKPVVVHRDARNTLGFDITADPPSPSYECKIVDAKGKTLLVSTISAEQAKQPIDLDLPNRSLDPGEYSLIVTGTGGVSVLNKTFTVQ